MWDLSFLDGLFLITIPCFIGIGAYRGWLPFGGPDEALRDDMGALIALIVTLFIGHQAVVLHRKLGAFKVGRRSLRTS